MSLEMDLEHKEWNEAKECWQWEFFQIYYNKGKEKLLVEDAPPLDSSIPAGSCPDPMATLTRDCGILI